MMACWVLFERLLAVGFCLTYFQGPGKEFGSEVGAPQWTVVVATVPQKLPRNTGVKTKAKALAHCPEAPRTFKRLFLGLRKGLRK